MALGMNYLGQPTNKQEIDNGHNNRHHQHHNRRYSQCISYRGTHTN